MNATETASPADLLLRMPARAENIAVARQAVAGVCEALGASGPVVGDVKLATTEACTNVVVHAYENGQGIVEIEARGSDGELVVAVRDAGSGMGPRSGTKGLGLGLPLIAALTRTVAISEAPGGGTQVLMTFDLRVPAVETSA